MFSQNYFPDFVLRPVDNDSREWSDNKCNKIGKPIHIHQERNILIFFRFGRLGPLEIFFYSSAYLTFPPGIAKKILRSQLARFCGRIN